MPINWTAIADIRRVEAVATGTLSASDWIDFIAALRKANVRSYAKLFDLSLAFVDMRAPDIQAIAGMINVAADAVGEPLGPVAFVVDSANALDLTLLYEERTVASRPLAIFASRALAIEWLEGLAFSGGG